MKIYGVLDNTKFLKKPQSEAAQKLFRPATRFVGNALTASLIALAAMSSVNVYGAEREGNEYKKTEMSQNNNSIIETKAKELNLSPTPNNLVYYDNKKSAYYMWNNKEQKFNKSKIVSVYKTGYLKTKNGEYLDPKGNLYILKDLGKYLIPRNGGFRDLGPALAVVNGYKQSDISKDLHTFGISNNQKLDVFYDEEKQQYVRWNDDSGKFESSPVTEVTGQYYSEGNRRYKIDYIGSNSSIKEVNEKEYQVNKAGLLKIENNDSVFSDKNFGFDRTYYYWDKKESKLVPIGDNADIQKMVNQKADGKIGDFRQGDIGDCWLLAPINGMLHHKNPVLREKYRKELEKSYSVDEDNNITVNLRGVNKKYTFTPEEIDSVLTKSNHYSIGEREVVAIEMGVEKFLRTLSDTKFSRGIYTNTFNMYVPPVNLDSDYVLDGGKAHNAFHIITGKEAHVVHPTILDNIIRIDNVYQRGQITEKFLLDKLKNNIVILNYKEPGEESAHGVSLYDIDDKNMYVIDSNIDELDPNKTVRPIAVPKKKMFDELQYVTFTDLKTDISPEKSAPIKAKIEATNEVKNLIPRYYFKQ